LAPKVWRRLLEVRTGVPVAGALAILSSSSHSHTSYTSTPRSGRKSQLSLVVISNTVQEDSVPAMYGSANRWDVYACSVCVPSLHFFRYRNTPVWVSALVLTLQGKMPRHHTKKMAQKQRNR